MSEPTEDDRIKAGLILLTAAQYGGAPAAQAMIAAALAQERAKALATHPAAPGASERDSRPTGTGQGLPGDPAQAPTPGKGTVA